MPIVEVVVRVGVAISFVLEVMDGIVLVIVLVEGRADVVELVIVVGLFSEIGVEIVFEMTALHPMNKLENRMRIHKPDNKIFFILFVPKEVLKTGTKSTITEICKVNIIGL
jgi:hypothetical protein